MSDIISSRRVVSSSLCFFSDISKSKYLPKYPIIQSVLDYHHIPKHVSDIIKSLYTDFHTAIITSDFSTPFIQVGRGVLQGDCLSPLLLNYLL